MPSPSFDDEFDDSIFDALPDEVLNGTQAPVAAAAPSQAMGQQGHEEELRSTQAQLQYKTGELANIRRLLQDTQVRTHTHWGTRLRIHSHLPGCALPPAGCGVGGRAGAS